MMEGLWDEAAWKNKALLCPPAGYPRGRQGVQPRRGGRTGRFPGPARLVQRWMRLGRAKRQLDAGCEAWACLKLLSLEAEKLGLGPRFVG